MNFSVSLKGNNNHHKNELLHLFSKYKLKNAAFKVRLPQDQQVKDHLLSSIPTSSTKLNFFTDILKEQSPQIILCQYSTRFHKLQIQSKDSNDDSDEIQSTLKITDPMLLYFIRDVVGEERLINLAKRFSLKIEITSDLATFTGKKEIIDEICEDINEIYSEQISFIDDKRALCLEKMNRITSLNRKYTIKILRLPQNSPPHFVIYGQSKKSIQKYKTKLTQAFEKIVLLEFTKPFLPKSQEKIVFQNLFEGLGHELQKSLSIELASKDEVGIIDNQNLENASLFLSLQRSDSEFEELCLKLRSFLKSFILLSCPEKCFSSSNLTDFCQKRPVCAFNYHNHQYCVGQKNCIQEILTKLQDDSLKQVPFSTILSLNQISNSSSTTFSLVPQKNRFTLKDIFAGLDLAKLKTLEENLSSTQGISHKYQILKSFLEEFDNTNSYWDQCRQNYHLLPSSTQALLQYFQQISHILLPFNSEYFTTLQRKYLSCYNFAWLDVFSWNARSIKTNQQKIRFLQIEKSAIQFIQEIWNPSQQHLSQFKNCKIIKRQNRQGGGTLTNLQKKTLKFLEEFPISEDMILCKVLINKTTVIWMVSIYLNKGLAQQVNELFEVIKKIIPSNEWRFILMAGDWNIDLLKESLQKTLLKRFCSELDLRIYSPRNPSRSGASLDYVVVGNSIDVDNLKTMESPSDHKAICFRIRVPNF